MFNYLRRVDFYEKIPHLVSIVVSFSLVLRPWCIFHLKYEILRKFRTASDKPARPGNEAKSCSQALPAKERG